MNEKHKLIEYTAFTKMCLLNDFPHSIQVVISFIKDRRDFKCTGMIDGIIKTSCFGYAYLNCLTIQDYER